MCYYVDVRCCKNVQTFDYTYVLCKVKITYSESKNIEIKVCKFWEIKAQEMREDSMPVNMWGMLYRESILDDRCTTRDAAKHGLRELRSGRYGWDIAYFINW